MSNQYTRQTDAPAIQANRAAALDGAILSLELALGNLDYRGIDTTDANATKDEILLQLAKASEIMPHNHSKYLRQSIAAIRDLHDSINRKAYDARQLELRNN